MALAEFNIVDERKEIVDRPESRFNLPFYLKAGHKIVVDINVRNSDGSVPILQTEQGPLPVESLVHYVREITEDAAPGMALQAITTLNCVELSPAPGVPTLGE